MTEKEISECLSLIGRKGGSVTSETKARSSAENGKKGGRPRKGAVDGFEISAIKDGKPRTLKLASGGGDQYQLVVVYPDGQSVAAMLQPPPGKFPDIKFWAEKNGFTLA
jgi:hypothetical protein